MRYAVILLLVSGLHLFSFGVQSTPTDWEALFDGTDLSQWQMRRPARWTVEEGTIKKIGDAPGNNIWNLWTRKQYENFELEVEVKFTPGANSGIFIRTADPENPVDTGRGIEIQVHDNTGREMNKNSGGALYDLKAPTVNAMKKPGEWNHFRITCMNNWILVALNREHIIEADLDLWSQAGRNPDGTGNKYSTAYRDMPRKGHIGFQDHGSTVGYRNVRIKRLTDRTQELFNGTSLDGWKAHGPQAQNLWTVGKPVIAEDPGHIKIESGDGALVSPVKEYNKNKNLCTNAHFGDCRLELEVMVPKNSNSGIYVMGRYEVQVLDSFGRQELDYRQIGGIYGVSVPKVNASKEPGQWQKFVIDFLAPRFDALGRKTVNAKFERVILNGIEVQKDVEVSGPTMGAMFSDEQALGPLMLQGDHGPVAYRNIRIIPR